MPVFRGCVALAYPDAWSGGRDPDTEDIALKEEVIPPQAAWPPLASDNPMIHFDLDPQNGESISATARGGGKAP